jgi:molybdenum cofactor guanylyltransferase
LTSTQSVPRHKITAVILAGGRATRLGGEDKGLLEVAGQPMIEYVLDTVAPQTGAVIINANRNRSRYAAYNYPIVADDLTDFQGPLAGMAATLTVAATPYVLFVPCDSPLVPPVLAARLFEALRYEDAEIAAAHNGERLQPVFALMSRELIESLHYFLSRGGRKIERWYSHHWLAQADFSDMPEAFMNVNTPADRDRLEKRLTAVRQQSKRGDYD